MDGGGATYLVSRHQIPSYAILMLPGSRQILSLLNIYRWSADFQRISDSGGGGEGEGKWEVRGEENWVS